MLRLDSRAIYSVSVTRSLGVLALALNCFLIFLRAGVISLPKRRERLDAKAYSTCPRIFRALQVMLSCSLSHAGYLDVDYPSQWPIHGLSEPVHLGFENSHRYMLSSDIGAADWNSLYPTSNGTLYLGPSLQPFTPALFHRIHCLNVIRGSLSEEFARAKEGLPPKDQRATEAEHCMNYARQSTLCASDTTINNVRKSGGSSITAWEVTHICRDWTAVYAAAEQNWKDYQASMIRLQSFV